MFTMEIFVSCIFLNSYKNIDYLYNSRYQQQKLEGKND